MNKIKIKKLVLAGLLISGNFALAEADGTPPTPPTPTGLDKVFIPKNPGGKPANRPRKPMLSDYLSCTYGAGYLEIEIPEEEEWVDITLTDGFTTVWADHLTQGNNVSFLPDIHGEYLLTCITASEDVYQVNLNF